MAAPSASGAVTHADPAGRTPSGRSAGATPPARGPVRPRRRSRLRRNRYRGRNLVVLAAFLLPAAALYGWLFVGAVGQTVLYSFYDWNAVSDPVPAGLDNFTRLASDPVFGQALVNTLYMTVLLVFVQLPGAFLLAWFLYRRVRGWRFLRTVYFLPVVISTAAVALLFGFLYEPNFGVLNALLERLGLDDLGRDWLGDPLTAMTAVSVPLLWKEVGLMMIILLAAMQGLPGEVLEAAEIDGVNGYQRLRHVVLPLLSRAIGLCLLLCITTAFKVFDFVLLMTGGGPGNRTEITGSYLYAQGFQRFEYGYGSAVAVVITGVVVVVVSIPRLFRLVTGRRAA